MNHHRNSFVGVEVSFPVQTGQAKEGAFGILDTSLPHKPPGRLRGHRNANEQRNRPHPLKPVWNPIRPLVIPIEHRLDHSNSDELSKTPAKVDISGEVSAERNRTDLGRISDGESLEDTPWNTTENLGSQQRFNVLRGEKN